VNPPVIDNDMLFVDTWPKKAPLLALLVLAGRCGRKHLECEALRQEQAEAATSISRYPSDYQWARSVGSDPCFEPRIGQRIAGPVRVELPLRNAGVGWQVHVWESCDHTVAARHSPRTLNVDREFPGYPIGVSLRWGQASVAKRQPKHRRGTSRIPKREPLQRRQRLFDISYHRIVPWYRQLHGFKATATDRRRSAS
jgi:hypothetical protein